MSKVHNYLMIMAGLLFLLTLAGIETGASNLITQTDIMNNPQNFVSSQFFAQLVAALIIGTVGGVLIGYFTKSSPKDIVIGSFLGTFLVYFVADMVNIMIYVDGLYGGTEWEWIKWIVFAIFVPLSIGFATSVLDFYHGGS